jgi:dipeptidase D
MAPPPAAAAADPSSFLVPYADPADVAHADEAAKLDPPAVFSLFAELARIPRPSAKEHRALDWLKAKADALGLPWQQDARGNLVVRRPAGPGCEDAPGVILQAHIDMVTEANVEVSHDWLADPVRLRVVQVEEEAGEDDGAGDKTKKAPPATWLRAHGTTLGADNGVGLCAALAVLALPADTPLPPLEALVTVEEESGLHGASCLDASMLKGSVLLNLDSEMWPEVTVGCAGAGDTVLEAGGLVVEPLPAASAAADGAPPLWLRLSVEGLSGGHSGLQIAEGRGNAVQMLATAARLVRRRVAAASSSSSSSAAAVVTARLALVDGGDKRNAIAREARCDVALVGGAGGGALVAAREAAQAAVDELAACWKEEYGSVEPALRVVLAEVGGGAEEEQGAGAQAGASSSPLALLKTRRAVLRDADAERVLTLLSVLPHGPVRFSPAMPGLVETSNNTASIKLEEEDEQEEQEGGEEQGGGGAPKSSSSSVKAVVQVSTRSSFPHAISEQRDRIALAARGAGATEVLLGEPYAGWAPDPKAPLARLVARCIAEVEAEEGNGGGGGGAKVDVPIVALHAGLECGVLREKLLARPAAAPENCGGGAAAPRLPELVSFGPTILGAHSPDERIDVATTGKFWRALLKVLAELAKAK